MKYARKNTRNDSYFQTLESYGEIRKLPIVGKEKMPRRTECSDKLICSAVKLLTALLWEKGDTNSRIKPEMVFSKV